MPRPAARQPSTASGTYFIHGASSSMNTSRQAACSMPATGERAPERTLVAVRASAPVAGRAASQRCRGVGDALRDQLAVGAMAAADHAVGHHRGQQRLDAGQERDRERAREQLARAFEGNVRQREVRQLRWDAAEARADGLDRQVPQGAGQGCRTHRDQESGPRRTPAAQCGDQSDASRAPRQRRPG